MGQSSALPEFVFDFRRVAPVSIITGDQKRLISKIEAKIREFSPRVKLGEG